MGIVYRGHDVRLDRPVAIKIMRSEWLGDGQVLDRFEHERQAMARLDHAHVVRLLDSGSTSTGLPFMVLEWIDGRELGALLQAEAPLALARIARLLGQVLRGLAAVHDAGVVHGDLKLSNILVVRRGRGESVKIIDFGLASERRGGVKVPADALPGCHDVCGTPEYMAPELMDGRPPDVASDLYAVGVLLYELLTGDTPFGGGAPAQILARHLLDEPVRPSLRCPERVLPEALDDVLLRALAKQPARRYPGATEMAEALDGALGVTGMSGEWRCPRCEAPTSTPVSACGECGAEAHATGRRSSAQRVAATRPIELTPPHGTPAATRETAMLGQLRESVGDAIAIGDVGELMVRYQRLAAALAGAGRVLEAVGELEEGIDVVTGGGGFTASGPADLWRLILGQARLYLRLQRPRLARMRGFQAALQAVRSGSDAGREEARLLLAALEDGGLEATQAAHAAAH